MQGTSAGERMISLERYGLEIKWSDEQQKLLLGKGARSEPADLRTAKQMKDVLMNPEGRLPNVFYHMYRDVCMEREFGRVKGAGLKFCITVWPAFSVNTEYNKTYGHFHSVVPGTHLEYPEIYEVISGKAHFIQQANDGGSFVVAGARRGDKVVVPPGCGHATVNVGRETLLTLDCSARSSKSDYGPLKEKQGAMYYDTEDGFVKNTRYGKIPKMQIVRPTLAGKLGLGKECIYKEFLKKPSLMDFLLRPQDFVGGFGGVAGCRR